MALGSIGDVLRRSRERAGLSQEAAAEAVKVNRALLDHYEAGQHQVPLTLAADLARLYATPLEAFLPGEELVGATADVSELFRAASRDLGDKARAGLRFFEERLTAYVGLANDMGAVLPGRGRSPLPPAQTARVRHADWGARQVRHQLKLGDGPLGDLFHLLDEHVLIWRLPLGTNPRTAPSGLFHNHPQAGFSIVVNSDLRAHRQLFALAHELAHAFFHSQGTDVVVSMSGKIEHERFANFFAGEFLVPTDRLRSVATQFTADRALPERSVVSDIQQYFGVDLATIRVRLVQEGLISRTDYHALAEKLSARPAPAQQKGAGGYEPQPLEAQPPRVLRLVRAALKRSVINRSAAAKLLGTSGDEIRRLLGRQTGRVPKDEATRGASVVVGR